MTQYSRVKILVRTGEPAITPKILVLGTVAGWYKEKASSCKPRRSLSTTLHARLVLATGTQEWTLNFSIFQILDLLFFLPHSSGRSNKNTSSYVVPTYLPIYLPTSTYLPVPTYQYLPTSTYLPVPTYLISTCIIYCMYSQPMLLLSSGLSDLQLLPTPYYMYVTLYIEWVVHVASIILACRHCASASWSQNLWLI